MTFFRPQCCFKNYLKILIIIIICFSVFVIFTYLLDVPSVQDETKFNLFHEDRKKQKDKQFVFAGEKIVHIDLKGAPPKVTYFKYLFPLLTKLGATGILIEYEDMFPYKENLNISALNSYSMKDINTINQLAIDNNLKVIPLLPTFGHMEFVLKLFEYVDFREVAQYPQVICPTYKDTENLIETMIKQIIFAHPNISYIHIGADEVNHIGICNRCTDVMMQTNISKNQLFVQYINKIIKIINKINPNVKILMWDDQLRSFTEEDLKLGDFNNSVEPVIWKYTKDVYDDLGPSLWGNYKKVFKNIWIASAFKGASEGNEIVSYVTHYLQNHRSWMYVVSEYQDQFDLRGIIITGSQRYDHFSILSELLPVSLPTLAMCLRILLGYNDSPLSPPTEVAKLLKCDQPYALMGPVFGSPKCLFPGGNILEHILRFQQLKQEFETVSDDFRVKRWMSDFNVNNCYSNTISVESLTAPLERIREDLNELKSDLTESLLEIYDEFTVKEWKGTFFIPFEKQVESLWSARNKLLNYKHWNRRPYNSFHC